MKKFNLTKYILPSVISMVLVGTYTNIDGLFIGNRAGDEGLAAINIAWPIVAFITSVGTGLGVGSSALINLLKGQNLNDEAESLKTVAFWLLLIAGALVTIICLLCYSPVLKLLQASGKTLQYAKDYALLVSAGAIFQVVGAGAVVLLRSDEKTYTAMIYTTIGLAVHVVVAFLSVGKFELYGVAAATVISQFVIAVLSCFSLFVPDFLKRKKNGLTAVFDDKKRKPNFRDALKILKNSIAPFGLNFVPSVVLLFTNYFALSVGGTPAVSAYAVMSYVFYTLDYVFQGVCDGVQPVLSYYEGAADFADKKKTLKSAIIILALVSLAFILLTPFAVSLLPRIFAISHEAEKMLRSGLIIYAFSYAPKAVVKLICAYSYSTEKTRFANVITYSEPLLFTPLCLAFLSVSYGINGVWAALPLSQVLIIVFAIVLALISKNKKADKQSL